MKKIISKLTRELLEEWGFTYDGYYWVHFNYPFKLITANKPNTYMVEIEGAGIGQNPPPIETNSQLLQLIMNFSGLYLQSRMKDQQFLNQNIAGQFMAKTISEFLSFDKNLSFRLMMSAMGQGNLAPDNEYTHTLISGYECEFEVSMVDSDGDKRVETIYYNPECISYPFVSSLFEDCEVTSISIVSRIDTEVEVTPFFGCGLPKVMEKPVAEA